MIDYRIFYVPMNSFGVTKRAECNDNSLYACLSTVRRTSAGVHLQERSLEPFIDSECRSIHSDGSGDRAVALVLRFKPTSIPRRDSALREDRTVLVHPAAYGNARGIACVRRRVFSRFHSPPSLPPSKHALHARLAVAVRAREKKSFFPAPSHRCRPRLSVNIDVASGSAIPFEVLESLDNRVQLLSGATRLDCLPPSFRESRSLPSPVSSTILDEI